MNSNEVMQFAQRILQMAQQPSGNAEQDQAVLQLVPIALAALQNDPQAIQQLEQVMLQVMSQLQLQLVLAAKFGAKLNYLKQLSGNCPKGTELQYFKVGGRVCKKCVAKAQNGADLEQDSVEQFKCGRKIKKAAGGDNLVEKNDKTGVNRTYHPAIKRPGSAPSGLGYLTGQGWDNNGNYMVRKPKTQPAKQNNQYEGDAGAGAPEYDKRFNTSRYKKK